MILNRLEPGTNCTVLNTGQEGTIKRIYFYPTKYEIEFLDGHIEHHSSKDLEIDGVKQQQAQLKIPSIPENGVGMSWNNWYPFKGESMVEHHFSTTKEIMWDMLTSLEMYNVWFHGIQRALPVIETERYVHKYSFNHLELKPGNYFKIRPKTIAPWFKCRIMTLEKNKEFGFTFKTNPLMTEYVHFSIRETEYGVWLTCKRTSKGLFSMLSQLNWKDKSIILQNLDKVIPKVSQKTDSDGISDTMGQVASTTGGFEALSKDEKVAYLVNKGLDGDMDTVNNHTDKVVRGKTKAMMVKIKRGSVERPPMPEISVATTTTSTENNSKTQNTDDEIFKDLVAKGIDGNMDEINALENRVLRGKIKAAIVKAKRESK